MMTLDDVGPRGAQQPDVTHMNYGARYNELKRVQAVIIEKYTEKYKMYYKLHAHKLQPNVRLKSNISWRYDITLYNVSEWQSWLKRSMCNLRYHHNIENKASQTALYNNISTMSTQGLDNDDGGGKLPPGTSTENEDEAPASPTDRTNSNDPQDTNQGKGSRINIVGLSPVATAAAAARAPSNLSVDDMAGMLTQAQFSKEDLLALIIRASKPDEVTNMLDSLTQMTAKQKAEEERKKAEVQRKLDQERYDLITQNIVGGAGNVPDNLQDAFDQVIAMNFEDDGIPGEEYYEPMMTVDARKTHYRPTWDDKYPGLGLTLTDEKYMEVMFILENGHHYYSNEPKNKFAQQLMFLIDMLVSRNSLLGRRGDVVPSKEVMTGKTNELAIYGGWIKREDEAIKLEQRHSTYQWNVLKGFNIESNSGNPLLSQIAETYFKMRGGVMHSKGKNEVATAIEAIQWCMVDSTKDTKSHGEDVTFALPLILLVNGHIKHFLRSVKWGHLPEIRYHPSHEHDTILAPMRNKDTKGIWVMKENERTLIGVEAREDVRNKILSYLNSKAPDGQGVVLPDCVGRPANYVPPRDHARQTRGSSNKRRKIIDELHP